MMVEGHKARQYQDTVFRLYFSDASRLRELAGALHGRTYTSKEQLKIVTLEGAFLSQLKNDISFILAGRHLVFIEHQSTPNENMPLRCLYYVCEQFRREIDAKLLYQNRKIVLPVPEFHVFYTGTKMLPEESVVRLSDAFSAHAMEANLELRVRIHNVVYGEQKQLLIQSRALHDYSFFIDAVKRNIATGIPRVEAIRSAIRYCKEHEIMRLFLEQHEKEVIDMVDFEWNQELFEEAKIEEGREQGKSAMILGMLREKMPLEMIAKISELSLDKVRELGRMHSLL
jgi:hypothetical protein